MKTKVFLFVLFSGICLLSFAQNEFSKWYFGQRAGLDFSTSPPTALTNGSINTSEGVATICDGAGNLLFYSDGTTIWNSTHTIMANGSGLFSNGSVTQAAIIVKQPGSSNIYYVFTANLSASPNGISYSIVDMSLAAGLGSVTVKNALLYAPTCEKQVAVRHCNGRDVWIISHRYNSNEFLAYLLTSTGVSTNPIVSAVGGTVFGGISAFGHIKISPDGKKLAVATTSNSVPPSLGLGGFYLFDFDASTGIVFNPLTLLDINTISNVLPYGVEFSPDGSKLYGTTGQNYTLSTSALYQWDICAPTTSAIIASQYSISLGNQNVGSVQRAIDGKLYVSIGGTVQSISVINNPNANGSAMNFSLYSVSLGSKYPTLGLPNYINGYTHTVPAPFTQNLACQTASFTLPPVPTFSSGCSPTPYAPNAYLWDFGEPSSGAANSSTLTNPVHTYSSTGTYSVTLILYGNCTNDTLRQTVTVSTPGPSLNVSGNFNICKGDKYTYTATGANSYTWSNNSTLTSIALSPQTTTVYSVSGTLNGCTLSKSFTITVDPCTGISALQNSNLFKVYPNPFEEVITIESESPAELIIMDMKGARLLESKIEKGRNEISSSTLAPGIYFLQVRNSSNNWRGRFVKVY